MNIDSKDVIKFKRIKIIIKNKAFESIRPGKFNINFTSNSKY